MQQIDNFRRFDEDFLTMEKNRQWVGRNSSLHASVERMNGDGGPKGWTRTLAG